jgi:hypothetical protein
MPLKFKKSLISKETYETAAAFDVDGDGIPDIVSGGWWYKGPDFEERHKIRCPVCRRHQHQMQRLSHKFPWI